jgi:hypothetical protein
VVGWLDVTLDASIRLPQIPKWVIYCLGLQHTGDLRQPNRRVFRRGSYVGLRELLPAVELLWHADDVALCGFDAEVRGLGWQIRLGNGPHTLSRTPRRTTGYRFTNSSTFLLMVACSDLKAECSSDKRRRLVSPSRSDAMSKVSFRMLIDSLGMA